MPGRFGRHGKSSQDDWGSEPSRSSQVAEAVADQHPEPVEPKKAPGKKDTNRWCKGKVGRKHEPITVLDNQYRGILTCGWVPSWRNRYAAIAWKCWHNVVCATCGKRLVETWHMKDGECPAYPGTEEQKADAERKRAEIAARIASRKPRRGRIAGPSHYRKKTK